MSECKEMNTVGMHLIMHDGLIYDFIECNARLRLHWYIYIYIYDYIWLIALITTIKYCGCFIDIALFLFITTPPYTFQSSLYYLSDYLFQLSEDMEFHHNHPVLSYNQMQQDASPQPARKLHHLPNAAASSSSGSGAMFHSESANQFQSHPQYPQGRQPTSQSNLVLPYFQQQNAG